MNVAELKSKLNDYPDNAEVRLLNSNLPVDLMISYTSDDDTKENADFVVFSKVTFDV
jgi:hypothetical protein